MTSEDNSKLAPHKTQQTQALQQPQAELLLVSLISPLVKESASLQ